MADLTITINDDDMPLLIDALCHKYGWGTESFATATTDERTKFAYDSLAADFLQLIRENEGRIASEKAAAEAAATVAHLDITVS